MQRDRAHLLSQLLKEMRETCGDRFPDEAWYEIHRCFAIPYVEVVLPEFSGGEWKVFLVQRDAGDPHWPGRPWHIPGGIWRVSRTRAEACNDIALGELGVGVRAVEEVMSYKWPDHAYANAISHVCLCEASTRPREVDAARFVSMNDLPKNMLLHHREFVDACERELRRRQG